ncbi:MAG TPA: YceI family protein [Acidimicrobiales bacterium]|jgi:polyisoprenoid-binding protein YceI
MSTPPPRRRWKRWIVGAVILAVVLVVGIPFIYIHFIEGKAPAPLTLSTQTTTTVAGAGGTTATTTAGSDSSSSPTIDGTWNVASGSTAGYRIKETLFGQSHTAVGRTNTIKGAIVIAGTEVTSGQFSVDMTTVKSDSNQRDGQFQGRIMDTSTFPTATFVLTQPIQLGSLPADGVTVTANATGKLTLHGTTKTVTFPVQARRTGSTISASGTIPVTFADYGIDNPSGGPATTSNSGSLEFLLNFSK